MKTTEAQISKLIAQLAKLAGMSNNKMSAIEAGREFYLSYENAPVYGGYRLIMINVKNGSHYGAFGMSSTCPRQKPATFSLMLESLILGLEYAKDHGITTN